MRARLTAADLRACRALRTRADRSALTPAIRVYSAAGEHAALWLVLGAAGAALDRARRPRWLRAAAVVGGTYALNTAVKLVIRRPRPALDGLPPLIATPTRFSFPSAHASTSFAAARAYGRLLPAAPLRAAAAAMGVSRVYLGVHYPSDVVAGALLGALTGGLAR